MSDGTSGSPYGTLPIPAAQTPNGEASTPASPLLRAEADVGDVGLDLDRPASLWRRLVEFYERNVGLFFVFTAQLFASIVSCPLLNICISVLVGQANSVYA